MWKVLLAFISHRIFLLIVILFTINSTISPLPPGKTIRPVLPVPVLFRNFLKKVSESSEALTLVQLDQRSTGEVFHLTDNPFLWLNRFSVGFLRLPPVISLLLFSNLFFILFLWQLYILVERLAIPEVGIGAAVLVTLWITSYELSMGASLSFSCFLIMATLRHAIDNQWLLSGISLGFLGMVEPLAAGLLPVLAFVFWYFQRHFQWGQVLKRLCFFLLPIGLVILHRWSVFKDTRGIIEGSALINIVHMIREGGKWSWALSQSNMGQTLSVVFFLIGGICAAIMNTSILYRIIPLYVLFTVLLYTPFGMVASRLTLAGVCLGGIAAVSSGIVNRLLQLLLFILGTVEVVSLFG